MSAIDCSRCCDLFINCIVGYHCPRLIAVRIGAAISSLTVFVCGSRNMIIILEFQTLRSTFLIGIRDGHSRCSRSRDW